MSTEKIKKTAFKEEIIIPENVELNMEGSLMIVKGPQGSNERRLSDPKIKIKKEDNKLILTSMRYTKKEKRILKTIKSHLNNLIKGVINQYIYTLKICSGHFPMNVSVSNNKVIIKNFFAEKIGKKPIEIPAGVEVKINGDIITVKSVDLELAGQTASNIEQACRITNRDRRIFMDGIYITSKAEK